MRQRFIHGYEAITHAEDSFTIAQCPVKSLTQRQRHIFNCMVRIHFQITLRPDRQVKQPMNCEVSQHMIEETYTRGYFMFAHPIQFKLDSDLSLIRLTRDFGGSHVCS